LELYNVSASDNLQTQLGYRFNDPALLQLALTHPSIAHEQGIPVQTNQRLEFLGDAVLGLVTAEWLYERHPELPEGELSKLKAQLVSRPALAAHAERLELGPALRIGVGEERSGGRTKASLLADSMEAVFGAVYLDGGLEAARRAILPMLENAFDERARQAVTDAKTQLQEVTQALGLDLPEYRLAGASGPDHSKVFTVECWVGGELTGRGEGPSKKMAEQKAAAEALAAIPTRG
jgi:ribonuclease-3